MRVGHTRHDLCDPPRCVRYIGHPSECRPTYYDVAICGAPMPLARATCVRRAGHAQSSSHRSRYALDNNRDAKWVGIR